MFLVFVFRFLSEAWVICMVPIHSFSLHLHDMIIFIMIIIFIFFHILHSVILIVNFILFHILLSVIFIFMIHKFQSSFCQ
mmetsp:Transcript_17793/g.43531  ORF Transcript_17793/g.43531 Transcript_17793/m.43531 type:complete len:80 (-) Transcript_17793:1522-1761(-)